MKRITITATMTDVTAADIWQAIELRAKEIEAHAKDLRNRGARSMASMYEISADNLRDIGRAMFHEILDD